MDDTRADRLVRWWRNQPAVAVLLAVSAALGSLASLRSAADAFRAVSPSTAGARQELILLSAQPTVTMDSVHLPVTVANRSSTSARITHTRAFGRVTNPDVFGPKLAGDTIHIDAGKTGILTYRARLATPIDRMQCGEEQKLRIDLEVTDGSLMRVRLLPLVFAIIQRADSVAFIHWAEARITMPDRRITSRSMGVGALGVPHGRMDRRTPWPRSDSAELHIKCNAVKSVERGNGTPSFLLDSAHFETLGSPVPAREPRLASVVLTGMLLLSLALLSVHRLIVENLLTPPPGVPGDYHVSRLASARMLYGAAVGGWLAGLLNASLMAVWASRAPGVLDTFFEGDWLQFLTAVAIPVIFACVLGAVMIGGAMQYGGTLYATIRREARSPDSIGTVSGGTVGGLVIGGLGGYYFGGMRLPVVSAWVLAASGAIAILGLLAGRTLGLPHRRAKLLAATSATTLIVAGLAVATLASVVDQDTISYFFKSTGDVTRDSRRQILGGMLAGAVFGGILGIQTVVTTRVTGMWLNRDGRRRLNRSRRGRSTPPPSTHP